MRPRSASATSLHLSNITSADTGALGRQPCSQRWSFLAGTTSRVGLRVPTESLSCSGRNQLVQGRFCDGGCVGGTGSGRAGPWACWPGEAGVQGPVRRSHDSDSGRAAEPRNPMSLPWGRGMDVPKPRRGSPGHLRCAGFGSSLLDALPPPLRLSPQTISQLRSARHK